MPRLLMIPPAPLFEGPDGGVVLDVKFVEGMRLQSRLWPGRIICVMRRGLRAPPFPIRFDRRDLGWELRAVDPGQPVSPADIADCDLALCSGDLSSELGLAGRRRGRRPGIVYAVEYTLGTRLRIVMLDRDRGPARKLASILWNLRGEFHRRRAFRRADGLQVNGYPAYEAYRRLNPNTLLYLDSRVSPELLATEAEMAARARRLETGAPLRLIHSGRLEPMKGAQDLIPVARALRAAGIDFSLDIYGLGSLEAEIAAGIRDGLASRVRLRGPVDFERELVPIARSLADVFLSCHRQADPSCTYLEAMGCGLPIVGYDNAMWRGLARESGGGWTAPVGDVGALARRIGALDSDRAAITAAARAARDFAARHDFVAETERRVAHLRATLPE